ncbi:hypothetical protein EPO44_02215, partial [bacterium]
MGRLVETGSALSRPSPEDRLFHILASRLRKKVKNKVDVLEASSRFGVNPSTIYKILEGRAVSFSLKKKLIAHFQDSKATKRPGPHRVVSVEKLNQVFRLFQREGTLAAVARRLGVTRERVRQFMTQGSQLGLFKYQGLKRKPFRRHSVAKEKLLRDYKAYRHLHRVADVNRIPFKFLHELLTLYGVTREQLRSLRVAARQARIKEQLISRYRRARKRLGYNPTIWELSKQSGYRRRDYQRIASIWGSVRAFRKKIGH